jgi:hypothetical protein
MALKMMRKNRGVPMTDRDAATDHTVATSADAEHSRERAVAAGRWFARYLVFVGLASAALIVLLEVYFPDGLARVLAGLPWLVVMIGLSWWAEQQSVYPAGATRYMWASIAGWLALYLVAVGPLVRWQFGEDLVAWLVAAVVMSIPFLAAAGLVLRRR